MNMQAMMQQAQKIQKEIAKAKSEIDEKEFELTKSFVTVKVNGKKEILKIEISDTDLKADDIEVLGDIIMLALNELYKNIDKEIESKLGKYGIGSLGF